MNRQFERDAIEKNESWDTNALYVLGYSVNGDVRIYVYLDWRSVKAEQREVGEI
jgi:hypothetical protein